MYEIKASPIHGKGMFAIVDIPVNHRIASYDGEKMSYHDFIEKYGHDWRYCYKVQNRCVYVSKEEPYRKRNPINWVNHS